VTFDVISDCEGSFATVREAFPGVDDDEPWWIPVNVVLLRTDDATLLVDTGAGPKPRAFFADGDARLLEELEQLSVAPADVDIVVHTHLHIDHVGWDGAFPNARYVVHEEDWAYFMSEESLAQRPHLREKVLPLDVERVTEETEIAPGVLVFPTPGHTPGHMSLRAGARRPGRARGAGGGSRPRVRQRHGSRAGGGDPPARPRRARRRGRHCRRRPLP